MSKAADVEKLDSPTVLVETVGPMEEDSSFIEHRKHFSLLAVIGLSFAVLNSPTAASASLSVIIGSGGPVAVIYGMLISGVGVTCIAASMAEICEVLTSAGGPYHWTWALAPPESRKGLAYATGWLAAAGWVTLTATASSLGGTLVVGIIALLHPGYEEKPYHVFLIYLAYAIGAWFINVFAVRALDGVSRAAFFWSIGGVVVIIISCLATASPDYQSGKFVFGTFINTTGWNNGVAFILGLLQSTFALVGTDGAAHLIDEMPRPHINAPLAMLLAPVLGTISSFVLLVVFLFVLNDYEQVSEGPAGPLLTIMSQALGDRGGAVALYMVPVTAMAFTAVSILCASSRQTQSFARDRGLPFPRLWSRESARWGVPIPAITLSTFFVVIFGLIFLGSSAALNAILSSSVIMLQWSYCVPVILLLIRGRSTLDTITNEEHLLQKGAAVAPVTAYRRRYAMGKWGWAVNVWGVAYALFTSVFFFFPPEVPATSSNVNYAVVVVAIVVMLAGASWVFDGKKHYVGPKDLHEALARSRAARD